MPSAEDKALLKKWADEIRREIGRYSPVSAVEANVVARAMLRAKAVIEEDDAETEGWFNNSITRALAHVADAMEKAGISANDIKSFDEPSINPAGYRRYSFAPFFYIRRDDPNQTTVGWDNEKSEMVVVSPVDWLADYESQHYDDFHIWHGRLSIRVGGLGASQPVKLDGYDQGEWGGTC